MKIRKKRQPLTTEPNAPRVSECLMKLAQSVLSEPLHPPPEIAYLAIILAQIAWNQSVTGETPPDALKMVREVWLKNPDAWSQFKLARPESLIAEMVVEKHRLFPNDFRPVLSCTMTRDGRIRAKWGQVGSA